jgi:hypothetical protein
MSHEVFDNLTRSLGSQLRRRDLLKAALFGMAGTLLSGIGLRPARAAANCLCGRILYDSATQCCIDGVVRTKHPIANLADCPNRVPHPGVPCAPNGCGAEGGQAFPGSFGRASFLGCCNDHDCCWGRCNEERNRCDTTFEACLRGACEAAYPPDVRTIPGTGTQVDFNRIPRESCRAASGAYHAGVQSDRWGTPAYVAAQQAACDCCGPQPCQTCPGGTCGALPSCQDPGCVCFQTVEGTGFCHLPQLCAGLSSCAASTDCPAGWACVSVTCCGSNPICIQPCFVVGGALVPPFGRGGSGRMTDGKIIP